MQMEEAIVKRLPADTEGKLLGALAAQEIEGQRPVLAWFATTAIEVTTINQYLQEAGFSGLSRVQDTITVPEIPLLGTGKTDYRTLQKLLSEHLKQA